MGAKIYLVLMLVVVEAVAGSDYYVISDNEGLGRRFDGIGGISGGSVS